MLKSTRGTRVLDDKKHVKTIPTKYAPVFEKVNSKMTFDKKRLNPDERKNLEIAFHWHKFLIKISTSNRILFRLIKDQKPVATRLVITPSTERKELILDNELKMVAPEKLFNLFPEPKSIFQNF